MGSVVSGWSSICGTASPLLVDLGSVSGDWPSLLRVHFHELRLSSGAEFTAKIVLPLLHEFVPASVESFLALVLSLLKFHSGLDVDGFHFLLVGRVQIIVDLLELLLDKLLLSAIHSVLLHVCGRIGSRP